MFFEPDIYFAAVNTDTALKKTAGYILGTSDSSSYYTWFYTEWMEQVQKLGFIILEDSDDSFLMGLKF